MNINYEQAKFVCSYAHFKDLPADTNREVAFVGRSNAGKSSVINTLTRQKHLAKTSRTPGRTQLLNFFELAEHLFLVDLPGFGYAKVNHKVKQRWHETIDQYLRERESLRAIVMVMDIRHPLTGFDLKMIDWAIAAHIPLHGLLNKADKLSRQAALTTLNKINAHPSIKTSDLITIQCFSALKREGVDILKAKLDALLLEDE